MAGPFARKRLILAAVLVAGLPSVAPYNFNSCSGGLFTKTCTARFSSHCCKSGTYLSATCCQNSCSEPNSSGRSSTKTCFGMTNSMCCSTKFLGSESCCDYADYSRTSKSRGRGDYLKHTYGTCIGLLTEYCLNSRSTACCSYLFPRCCKPARKITYSTCSGGVNTAYCTDSRSTSCCSFYDLDRDRDRVSCCAGGRTTCISSWYTRWYTGPTCYGTSAYCCHSSQSCCDYNSYEKEESGEPTNGALIGGGAIGGIVSLVLFIVVPIAMVCCRTRRARRASNTNTTVGFDHGAQSRPQPAFSGVTATSNQQARPQLDLAVTATSRSQSQPEPAFTAVTTTSNPQARSQPDLAVPTISNQSQPQPAYHQPPPAYGSLYPPQSDNIDRPPPYSSLQLQAPAAPQMQPGAPPV